MCRSIFQAVLLTFLGGSITTMVFADEDTIASKLEGAKAAYERDIEKLKIPILDWFNKSELAAQKARNNALIEQIKTERDRFENSGVVAVTLPKPLMTKLSAAHQAMDAAYVKAQGAYVKLGNKDKAGEIEAESTKFRRSVDPRREWIGRHSSFKYIDDTVWHEIQQGIVAFHFKETNRTAEYIELLDEGRSCWVIIFNNRALVGPARETLGPLSNGSWKR